MTTYMESSDPDLQPRQINAEYQDAYTRRYQAWQDRSGPGLDGLKELYATEQIDLDAFEDRVEALLEVLSITANLIPSATKRIAKIRHGDALTALWGIRVLNRLPPDAEPARRLRLPYVWRPR